MKNITVVLDAFGFFGGPERRAYRIAAGLKKAGHRLTIISIMKADDSIIEKGRNDGINIIELTDCDNRVLKSYRVDVFLKLRKTILKSDPDVIFTFEFLADYTTKMALLGLNIPIFTFIGSTEWKWEKKFHRRILMEYFSNISRFYMVNSLRVKKNVLRVLPKIEDKIKLIYNPIDTDYFKPMEQKDRIEARKQYNLGENEFIVGSVVRFYNPKGADTLIEAFYKSGINAKLVLIGDGSMKKKLENMVKNFNIKEMVLFLGAIEATPEVYSMFDVSVVPSQKGGFDNVVIESMACGIPTIATTETGIGELCENNKHLILTKKDAQSISEAIIYAFKHENDIKKLSKNGLSMIKNDLDIRHIVAELEKLLNRCE